jgi:uncharacterized membrane protein
LTLNRQLWQSGPVAISGRLLALFLAVCLAVVLVHPGVAQARTYRFERLIIKAEISEDGSLWISEQRTALFSGTFTGMFQWINQQPGVQISEVQVAEGDSPYTFRPGATAPGPANTYYIQDQNDRLYVDWSFQASDEIRTFTLSYRVRQQVQVHADVAELYYQFVGDQWEQGVERVEVTLTLPPGASKEDIRAWGHGPLHGEVEIADQQTVVWTVSPLPAQTMLEGRVTFPPKLITGDQAVYTGQTALPGILDDEERWANQANRERQRAGWIMALRRIDPGVALGALVFVVGLIWFWRRRYGRPYATAFQGDYYRELPGDYPPAELGVLWRFGDPTVDDFTATILDLARRRFIRIDEVSKETKGLLGKNREETGYRLTRLENKQVLTPPEKDLLEFLFEQVVPSGPVGLEDIERYAKEHPASFQNFWRGWVGAVRFTSERQGFFDDSGQLRLGRKRHFVAGGLMMALSVALIFLVGTYITGFTLLFSSLAMFISGAALKRRSRSGQEDYVRWQAFRRFLLHFSQLERQGIPALVIWEHYLVYAVTLGVAKEVLSQLEIVFPGLESDGYRFGYGWYYFGMGYPGFYGLNRSLTSMTSSLNQSMHNSLAATAASPRSSGGGFGGGFSGGGGFGGGGGGGGVR